MGFIRIVNPRTGKVVMEETDDGTIRYMSEQFEKVIKECRNEGRIPTQEELERMIAAIESEAEPEAGGEWAG